MAKVIANKAVLQNIFLTFVLEYMSYYISL